LANTIFFSAFCTYTLSLTLYTARTQKKHAKSKPLLSTHIHIRHNTHHTTPHIITSHPSPRDPNAPHGGRQRPRRRRRRRRRRV
jgi:hypothetical protein